MCFHFVIFTWLDNKRYIKSSPYNVFFPGFPAPSHVLSRLSELRGESDVISCLIRARFSSLLLGEFSPAALKPVSKTLFFRVKSSSLQTFPLILQLHRRVHRRGGGARQILSWPSRCFSNMQQLSDPQESRPSRVTRLFLNHSSWEASYDKRARRICFTSNLWSMFLVCCFPLTSLEVSLGGAFKLYINNMLSLITSFTLLLIILINISDLFMFQI